MVVNYWHLYSKLVVLLATSGLMTVKQFLYPVQSIGAKGINVSACFISKFVIWMQLHLLFPNCDVNFVITLGWSTVDMNAWQIMLILLDWSTVKNLQTAKFSITQQLAGMTSYSILAWVLARRKIICTYILHTCKSKDEITWFWWNTFENMTDFLSLLWVWVRQNSGNQMWTVWLKKTPHCKL